MKLEISKCPFSFQECFKYEFFQSCYCTTYIRLISTSIIYTWLYNSTKGSLFIVVMAHAGHNIAVTLIQSPWRVGDVSHLMNALSYLAAAIIIVLMTDPR